MLRFETAGESHGQCLVATLTGMPAGVPVSVAAINRELWRRQQGFGRGGRMKIETDEAGIAAGVRHGKTIGAPIAILIRNKDWQNWMDVLPVEDAEAAESRKKPVTRPRPGHADLAGALKYGFHDARYILERASARETAARVAAGAVCRQLLAAFGIEVKSGVLSVGPVSVEEPREGFSFATLARVDDASPFRAVDPGLEEKMTQAVDAAAKKGDTLGGTILVAAKGVPPGLGSHVSWDRKLDGRIGQAMLSIPSVKAVSIGSGVSNAFAPGSLAHDPVEWNEARGFFRTKNRAGGLEGGITNGEDVLVVVFQKPISTLRDGLPSVDLDTKAAHRAQYERSDVTAVPACGVIAEAMLAFVLADALLEKTGGDSMDEVRRNLDAFLAAQRSF